MILFVNGSPHRDGRTARMAADLLAGLDYETLNLIDYRIEPLYSAQADGDRFEQVRARVVTADVIVLGTPVYWHSLGALPRTLFERMYGTPPAGLAGRKLAFRGPVRPRLDRNRLRRRGPARLAQGDRRGGMKYHE